MIDDHSSLSLTRGLARLHEALFGEAGFSVETLHTLLDGEPGRKRTGSIPLLRSLLLMHEGLLSPAFEPDARITVPQVPHDYHLSNMSIDLKHGGDPLKMTLSQIKSVKIEFCPPPGKGRSAKQAAPANADPVRALRQLVAAEQRKLNRTGGCLANAFLFSWLMKYTELLPVVFCSEERQKRTSYIFGGFPIRGRSEFLSYPSLSIAPDSDPRLSRTWEQGIIAARFKDTTDLNEYRLVTIAGSPQG